MKIIVQKIILPKIEVETQKQIKEKIVDMYSTKKSSKSLLEIAKRGVEMAIEKDEQEAEKWINSELSKLETNGRADTGREIRESQNAKQIFWGR